jgi:hypothetical protein
VSRRTAPRDEMPPDFIRLRDMRCRNCGGEVGQPGSIIAIDGAQPLPHCSPDCARAQRLPFWCEAA